MLRNVYRSITMQYATGAHIYVSLDGGIVLDAQLPHQMSFRGRRVTLPLNDGYVAHLECDEQLLTNYEFEAEPISKFQQQQLFHYYEVGYRGIGLGDNPLELHIYVDGAEQEQILTVTQDAELTKTIRVYFDKLAYGYIPHIHNATTSSDGEVLWARPIALPPRFFRGVRTHAEFQVTYKNDVTLQWYLDGVEHGDPYVLPTVSSTTTEKQYFPSGTIGHVLQYRVTNPTEGTVFVVETDVTLADLEQQTMTQNTEERI